VPGWRAPSPYLTRLCHWILEPADVHWKGRFSVRGVYVDENITSDGERVLGGVPTPDAPELGYAAPAYTPEYPRPEPAPVAGPAVDPYPIVTYAPWNPDDPDPSAFVPPLGLMRNPRKRNELMFVASIMLLGVGVWNLLIGLLSLSVWMSDWLNAPSVVGWSAAVALVSALLMVIAGVLGIQDSGKPERARALLGLGIAVAVVLAGAFGLVFLTGVATGGVGFLGILPVALYVAGALTMMRTRTA